MKRIIFVTIFIFTFCLALYGQTNSSVCPQISLITPKTVMLPNSPVFFVVENAGKTEGTELRYEWSFSSGKILEGQGSPKVKFVVENQENTYVHIRLNIIGLPEICSSVFEDKVGVMPPIEGDPYDKFEKISPNDLRARLDNFIAALRNDPESTGFVQIAFDKQGLIIL